MNDITITSIETLVAFDLATGNFKFKADELQGVTISQNQDTTDITGKNGRKLTTLKRNKSVTISGENGLISTGLIELQTGSAFETKDTTVKWNETLTVTGNAATTSYKAVGTTGAEIDSVHVKNADGSLGKELTQDATTAEGKFAYAPASKQLTFTGLTDGTEIFVIYNRKVNASVHTNTSESYSGKCELFLDAFGEDTCGKVYHVQIHIPKADFSGNFELEFGDSQAVHSFEAEALAGACGANGELWHWTILDSGADDVA